MNRINKKYLTPVLVFIALSILIPLGMTFYEIITTEKESVIFLENYPPLLGLIIFAYYILILVLILVYLIYWGIKQFRLVTSLKQEKAQTELMHLKNQVSPHFFFNMLNNLYGLVAKDAPKAQEMILKLSDLMRYSIYDGQKENVLISEELSYLENYIELNKMRYHKQIDICFDKEIEKELKIMPLLFIILLENAFKHGVESLRNNAYVHVKLIAKGKDVSFLVENNFNSVGKREEVGIGLQNLRRRLELVYPNRHDLTNSSFGEVYRAELKITGL